jgi:hypothetical protein
MCALPSGEKEAVLQARIRAIHPQDSRGIWRGGVIGETDRLVR